MKRIFLLSFLALSLSWQSPIWAEASAIGAKLNLKAYYFPNPNVCTVMVDFQKSTSEILKTSGDKRVQLLSANLLAEYGANGQVGCKTPVKVRMLAVLVPGVDNYGRPDFGSRTNLIRLEGNVDKFRSLASSRDGLSEATIRKYVELEVYKK